MLSEQELLEMERPVSRASCADAAVRPRSTVCTVRRLERLRRGCAGGRTGWARERIESAERSDKLPDDAFFDFDPDFMDGMP